jgi:beta-glucosidase
VGERQPCVARPAKELKGFEKIFVKAGESVHVKVHLPKSAFSFYDMDIHDWRVNPGVFDIRVGASVSDIRLSGEITIK